jgi:hypothetical protein
LRDFVNVLEIGQWSRKWSQKISRVFAGSCAAEVSHLRLDSGAGKFDAIVERAEDGAAFEVKLSADVGDDDVAHLVWLREQLGDQFVDGAVVATREHAYRRRRRRRPLGLLGA